MSSANEDRTAGMGLRRSTIQLLRFPFSFFLMPVFWFAVSQLVHKDWPRIVLMFFILHGLVYPASNGYNSYMDRDETPVGGIKNPSAPTKQLFYVTVIMDVISLALSLLISVYFSVGILLYILASRAYSYRGIRLKRYPLPGYFTVVIFQGAVIFFLVYHGGHIDHPLHAPVAAMLASSLLVAGFYPLTQVYQHEADRRDGVSTISYLLGIRGTFVFALIIYFFAFLMLAVYFISSLEEKEFAVLATCMLPVLVYFTNWMRRVWKDAGQADFENTMRMNLVASTCTNLGFIIVLLMQ